MVSGKEDEWQEWKAVSQVELEMWRLACVFLLLSAPTVSPLHHSPYFPGVCLNTRSAYTPLKLQMSDT